MAATYPPIADTTALAARLGVTLPGADEPRAAAILDDVSAMARKLSGDSARWVDTSTDPDTSAAPDDVVAIVLAAARRLYRNPDGFASEQDGDYSYRIDSDSLARGGGMFTAAEIEVLDSYADTGGLWTQSISGVPSTTRDNRGILERIYDATFGGPS